MAELFSINDGPTGGRERIVWWRATKRERGAKIAALPVYKRHSYLDRLNIDKMLIRRSYDTYSRYECNNWHISFQVMNSAAEKRRLKGLPTAEDRKRYRFVIESFRMSRLGDGGPLAKLDAMTEGNHPFIYDRHSGFIMHEDELMNAMNAGIEFEMLTLKMPEGRAIAIYQLESHKKHSGFWSYDVHEKDRYNRKIQPGEDVRCQFYFSHPTDLLWFKFRYG